MTSKNFSHPKNIDELNELISEGLNVYVQATNALYADDYGIAEDAIRRFNFWKVAVDGFYKKYKIQDYDLDYEIFGTPVGEVIFNYNEALKDVKTATNKIKLKLESIREQSYQNLNSNSHDENFHLSIKGNQVWVNDKYLLSQPHGLGNNLSILRYLIEDLPPRTPVRLNTLPDWLKSEIGTKSFSRILNACGFTGEITKTFFVTSGSKSATFRGVDVDFKELSNAGVDTSLLIKELEVKHDKNIKKMKK